jgi:hypothetical protein
MVVPYAQYVTVSPSLLLKSLERNFSGVSAGTFAEIAELFFSEIFETVSPKEKEKWKFPENYSYDAIRLIKKSIGDTLREDQDPNHSACR